ncbi:MAG: LLM class flavin-dependent oxidoreductase [Candidatus Promineifilaceae bacterium]|nr:LLM class flavin-dependent oxidoreductase [Candidatus Promineifilaceae bacterium]
MSKAAMFGVSIHPGRDRFPASLAHAQKADALGLDIITVMDHPYNKNFFDTWTFLTALAMRTERVQLGTNVANLPLRPPAMLAKQAATLDVLSAGRMVLGLGAGSYWSGIKAFGGPERSSGEAYRAFKDALHILRGLWEHADSSFSYAGDIYNVKGARFGPQPAHRIPIWVGATGPQMLQLTGRMADGIWVSVAYVKPEQLDYVNENIDAGAKEAGRDPTQIRRGYNLMGVIEDGPGQLNDSIKGPVDYWIETLIGFHRNYRVNAFNFWPSGDDIGEQFELFAREVVPAVRNAIASD